MIWRMSIAHFLSISPRLNWTLPQRTCRLNKMSSVLFTGMCHVNWKILAQNEEDEDSCYSSDKIVIIFFSRTDQLQTVPFSSTSCCLEEESMSFFPTRSVSPAFPHAFHHIPDRGIRYSSNQFTFCPLSEQFWHKSKGWAVHTLWDTTTLDFIFFLTSLCCAHKPFKREWNAIK